MIMGTLKTTYNYVYLSRNVQIKALKIVYRQKKKRKDLDPLLLALNHSQKKKKTAIDAETAPPERSSYVTFRSVTFLWPFLDLPC